MDSLLPRLKAPLRGIAVKLSIEKGVSMNEQKVFIHFINHGSARRSRKAATKLILLTATKEPSPVIARSDSDAAISHRPYHSSHREIAASARTEDSGLRVVLWARFLAMTRRGELFHLFI